MNWYEKILLKILDSGEIPEHIAIIMDGNRRWANNHHLSSVSEGHKQGANKLKEIIEWFSHLHGIKILTVYAFSLLNFNRPKEEVDGLMDLAENTFKDLADNPNFFEKNKCKINFIGQIDLLEQRVKEQIQRIYDVSYPNPEFTLNICACYTSHDEIETARNKCFDECIEPTIESVFSHLDIVSKPNLLIRTSGVYRMSNFLLLQCDKSPIVVTDILWPDLNLFNIALISLKYQLRFVLP